MCADEYLYRERMLEAQVDKTAAEAAAESADNQVTLSTASAALPSIDSIRSGDQLMQTIDYIEQDVPDFLGAILADCVDAKGALSNPLLTALQQPSKSAVMLGLSPLRYLLRALRMIKQPDLEAVLLALPFFYVQRLLVLLLQVMKCECICI
jgi:hypothetical protein